MNPKFRRILATVGFAFMSLFSIFFVMYLINNKLFGGRIWAVAMVCLLLGIIIFAIIYIQRGFPFQQLKDEEARKQREEYLKKAAEEAAKTDDDQNQDLPEDDTNQNLPEDDTAENSADDAGK